VSDLDDRFTLIRGRGAYGRKPKRKGPTGLEAISQHAPVTVFHHDEVEGKDIFETIHDADPIFDNNKRLYTDGEDGYSPSRDMKRVASIPLGMVELLRQTMNINVLDKNDWPRLAALLDDPEYQFLRTAPGKVSSKPYREHVQVKEGWVKR